VAEISDRDAPAAAALFGAHLALAQRYVDHLATSGIERGLLGPREVPRLWNRHVLNCVVVGELIAPNASVADVGSGAGLPGLALAIARPDLRIQLIEPLERRVSWLNEVVEDLALANVSVLRARAEQAAAEVQVDVVTARAVSALQKLVPLTVPLLAGRGEVLAIKGRSAKEELAGAGPIICKFGGTDASVVTVGGAILDEPTTVVRIQVR
jgi:16S rRNA (guanine527-N7)-methyltransferase